MSVWNKVWKEVCYLSGFILAAIWIATGSVLAFWLTVAIGCFILFHDEVEDE